MNQVIENTNRWRFLITGVVVSLVLGMIYAWSIFTLPLENAFGWTRAQTSLTFSISIITLSVGMIFSAAASSRKRACGPCRWRARSWWRRASSWPPPPPP